MGGCQRVMSLADGVDRGIRCPMTRARGRRTPTEPSTSSRRVACSRERLSLVLSEAGTVQSGTGQAHSGCADSGCRESLCSPPPPSPPPSRPPPLPPHLTRAPQPTAHRSAAARAQSAPPSSGASVPPFPPLPLFSQPARGAHAPRGVTCPAVRPRLEHPARVRRHIRPPRDPARLVSPRRCVCVSGALSHAQSDTPAYVAHPLARSLGPRPSTVGSALRNNPFAPFVPCHRVIASSLYVGGFGGEWLKPGAARSSQSGSARRAGEGHHKEGERTADKVELLRREGVDFDERGYLRDKGKLWNGEKRADGDAAAGTRAKAAGRTAGGG